MIESTKQLQTAQLKPVQILEHGNYLYGTLDGLDFVPSGIMQDTKKNLIVLLFKIKIYYEINIFKRF